MSLDLTQRIRELYEQASRMERGPFASAADRDRARFLRRDAQRLEVIMHEPQDKRRRELARIHALKRDLRLIEDDYRSLVGMFSRGRTRTARELDSWERGQLIKHLASRLPERIPRGRWVQPRITLPEGRWRMGRKVCAMLAANGRGHRYADSMARHMFHVDRWEHLVAWQLHDLIAALEIDQRRRSRA